jgi:ABC-type transport system involved in multi-copper enzyme maturation permease subunit
MVACAGLAALAAVLVVTGVNMASSYAAGISSCGATHSCDQLPSVLFQNDGALVDLVAGTMILPALLGVLWGAPLVAGERESGTTDLIWTQSVTRRRWMLTNIGWALAVAVLWGVLLTILVSWWRIPENALFDRLSPGAFGIQGIVPIAYSAFAMALGIAAGVLLQRVVPAVVTALGGFIALRALIALFVRQHFIAPITHTYPINVSSVSGRLAHSWWLAGYLTDPSDHNSKRDRDPHSRRLPDQRL